jgi:hypothetical protein
MPHLAGEIPTGRTPSAAAVAAGEQGPGGAAAAVAPPPRGAVGRQPPFALALALTLVLAFAAFALVMAVVMLAVRPKPIAGLAANQRQDAETALYLVAFGVLLPLALVVPPRLARRIATGPNDPALSSLAALLSFGFLAAVLVVRLSDAVPHGGGMGALLLAVSAWWLVAGPALWRAVRPRPWRPLLRLTALAPAAWGATGALLVACALAVTDLGSVSVPALLLGAAAAIAVTLAAGRRGLRRLTPPWSWLADALAVAALLLAIPDLVIVRPEGGLSSPLGAFVSAVVQYHQDFLLGPANQVLAGSTMLVDTASQYGVAPIYLLAGWFQLAPIGYGTFGLLDGVLTALFFAAGYCVLRLAGCSRPLAVGTLALGVAVLVYNRVYPVGGLPQEGPLRFGLPMALVLALVAAARWPRRSRALRALALAVLGLSSVWALEALAYTVATFAAIACLEAYLMPAGTRLRWLARQAALGAVACICAHLVLALATLAAAGRLPDWGQYFAYLHAFLAGQLGDFTYDFSHWSPGLAVGAAYLASAAAVALLVGARRPLVTRERVTLLALTGLTAYGVALFSYFDDRSADHVLVYVSLPALLAAALWASLTVRRARSDVPVTVLRGGFAVGSAIAALLFAVAWSSIGPRFDHSALAKILPGNGTPGAALHRLWHFPPIDPEARDGQRLLARYMPGERRSVVLVKPDLGTEVLLRSSRANRLPIADPWEDSFVVAQRLPALRKAIASLRPGDRLLLDRGILAWRARLHAHPRANPIERIEAARAALRTSTAPLQAWAIGEIDRRFLMRAVRRDPTGLVVVALTARR